MSSSPRPADDTSLRGTGHGGLTRSAFIPSPAAAVQTSESVVVNPDPADWTPDILDGQVNAILQMGTKVIVGGTFSQVRRHGFSVDQHPQLHLRVRHGHRGDRPELRTGH